MILIRPLIRANDDRVYRSHTIIFFIFLVSNIGGSLTPLGDPPLFVGFLKGVDFFWTTTHLFTEMIFVAGIVLFIFVVLDIYLHWKEEHKTIRWIRRRIRRSACTAPSISRCIGVIIAAILMSAYWKPGITFNLLGIQVELQNIIRDADFRRRRLRFAEADQALLPRGQRIRLGPDPRSRHFVRLHLHLPGAGDRHSECRSERRAGAAARPRQQSRRLAEQPRLFLADRRPVVVPRQCADLSGVLRTGRRRSESPDGAAGADLAAISTGAVFMGANTYIGNAPNFMVYAIARHMGVPMPSFFHYMMWSGAILIPTFVLCGWLFF